MNYKAVIGLEMHCEIKSNAKVFSRARNEYNTTPNINVRPVDMGFPGTLPVVNKECIKKAVKMAMILNCQIPDVMIFDRKNYYYPDLPKGYQITQGHQPVGINGNLELECNGKLINVAIHDIHLEEDAASLDHYYDSTLIDYNRSGVPLLEVVTEPCLHSADEAVAFLEQMRRIYKYCDISEADTKKGQIRCDVNVSIMPEDSTVLGTKVEVKNINSFSNVFATINYEIERQTKLMLADKGHEIIQETRRFDEESNQTIAMRSKVDATDYKYFIEPNLPPYPISKEWQDEIRSEIPMLAEARKALYLKQYNLSDYDATIIVKEIDYANYFEACLALGINAKIAANWLTGQILAYINKFEINLPEFYLQPELLNQIIKAMEQGIISSKQAKEIFFKALTENKEPKEFISTDNAQLSDEKELTNIIKEILANNQGQVEQYNNGKDNLFDYFVGQVMKATKGKANPTMTKEILKKELVN